MKPLLILASAVLIAAPGQAENLLILRKQGNKLLEDSLNAANSKNWALACSKYKEASNFAAKHGLNEFRPVTGTPEEKRLIIKGNVLIAEANSMENKNGLYLCGKANMPWVKLDLPTTYNSPASTTDLSVGRIIRLQCEEKWGTDFQMIRYCIDQQTEAAQSLDYLKQRLRN